jgi:hypothetical protein
MGLEALERLPTDAKTFAIVARLLLDRGETERLWAGEPTRANKDALRSIVQLEQDTTQPRFRYSPGTPGRTAMPDTHDDETQGPEAPQAPARRPWHAPQFYLTEVASTYAQGGTIPDGSTTNGT